jgi:quinol monooxygenase YgiN
MTFRYRLTVIYPVPDFDRWAAALREARRPTPGVGELTVYRSIDDPNEVMVEVELESPEAARAYIRSTNLREFFDQAGVEIYPAAFIGELVGDLSGHTS